MKQRMKDCGFCLRGRWVALTTPAACSLNAVSSLPMCWRSSACHQGWVSVSSNDLPMTEKRVVISQLAKAFDIKMQRSHDHRSCVHVHTINLVFGMLTYCYWNKQVQAGRQGCQSCCSKQDTQNMDKKRGKQQYTIYSQYFIYMQHH